MIYLLPALLTVTPAQLQEAEQKLAGAEKTLDKAQAEVYEARIAYHTLQMGDIQDRLQAFQKKLPAIKRDPAAYHDLLFQQLPTLFDEERNQLALIIDEDPQLAPKAQALLDRILALLTHLNTEKRDLSLPVQP